MSQRKIWFLNRVKMFQELTLEEAEFLDGLCESLRYKRKQVIYMTGDPSDKIYLLKSGLVKVSKVTEDGKELTLSFFSQGDMFGELAVAHTGPRNTVAEAYEDSLVCAIGSEDFQRFLISHPHVNLELTRLIADRRRKLENKVDNLLFKPAIARIAGLFLELGRDFGVRDSRGIIINIKLTHREVANLIGSTRETVSFAFLDLKKQGLIESEGKRVVLLDLVRLEAIYDGRSG